MKKFGITIYLIVLLSVYLFLTGCKQETGFTERKPNIIIFFTDDQGYADVGCYGAEGFETPHLDKLATEGIRFTDFYVAATVCTPSRAGLLTGRYPKRANSHEAVIFPYSEHGLSPDEYTMAEMLKSVGYATACIGKWHLGHLEKFMPNNHGFDYFFGVPYSNDMDSYYYKHNDFQSPPLPLYRNKEIIEEGPDQRYLTRMYTEEAVRFIQQEKENPFFLYLPDNMPHTPLHVSENFEGKSDLGIYGDVIMELDWSVGEIVKSLKQEGIYENTLFIFTSDNGPQVGSALPLRGKKATTWEGGQRVPAIMVWPGKIPMNSKSSAMVTAMDLMPTLAKITRADIPSEIIMDGSDISELLLNPATVKLPERPFYYYARNGEAEAVRLGKWKLHISKSIGWKSKEEFPVSLYNLEMDISEKDNIAEMHPEIVEKLRSIILEFDRLITKEL
ncbi:MAG: sulfatase [Cyclobacteriaceae bacterium]|nr:sulfatase [Cyclobacteriaceae bacterium]